MEHGNWLTGSLVYLAAAVLAVPLARLLGLGSIIGYLAAGIVIGPFVLGFVNDAHDILKFAEFGVVLMLFLVGLELEPKRLWAMRQSIFGWGSVQLFGSAALIAGLAILVGIDWKLALVGGLGLGMSSTAIGLGTLAERNLGATASGKGIVAVSLLQDVAAIPILGLIPALATIGMAADVHAQQSGWIGAGKAVGVILAIVFGGRLLLRPALRWIAGSRTPEIFTAASLLLVVATAAMMQRVGLSMALGAFLAGVLLAESEYRRELETDLEPFKGLLLGLFFIAVGMSIDFGVVLQKPGVVALVVLAFLALKAAVLFGLCRGMQIPKAERPVFLILLAQGGEFGFVVFQTAAASHVIDAPTSSLLVAAVAISMLVTPLMLVAADKWWIPRLARGKQIEMQEIDEEQDAPVIIAGFGRYGQIVGRLLYANGFRATVLEHDAEQIDAVRRFGWPVFYGDATRLDLLRTAGAEKARVMVIAIDDIGQSVKVAQIVIENFPNLKVVARARNVTHYYELRNLGIELVDRETFESALMSGRHVMELLGLEPHLSRNNTLRFRQRNIDLTEQMRPHWRDEAKLIALAKQGRQQLEELFERERAARKGSGRAAGWDPSAEHED